MKSRFSRLIHSPTHRRFSKAIILCFGGAIAGISTQSAQAAPNVTHNITATGDGTWTGATWSNGTPDGTTAGDLATPGSINSVTTLDADVTIGSLLTTGSGRTWTINSNAFNALTLDGTGANTTTNGFGNADTAALRINTTGAGVFAINPNIVLATNTDIGTTGGDDEVVVGGNITASAAVTLNFQNNVAAATSGDVATVVNGSIGASGSSIAITNNSAGTGGGDPGSVTLSGALGSSVTSITQNSATSVLNLNGVSGSFGGTLSITAGTVTIGGAGQLGASGVYSANISNEGTLNFNSSANQTFSGIISGAGSLTKGASTTGTLVLSGANTYTGNTTVSVGTLVLSGSNSHGATAITSINGGTLQLQANVGNTTAGVCSALGTVSGNLKFDANNAVLQLRSDSAVAFGEGTNAMNATENGSYTIDVDRITAGTGAALTVGSINSAGATINVTGNSTGTGATLITGSIGGSSAAIRTLTINPTTANITVAGMNQGGIAGSSIVLSGTSTGNSVTGAITGANAALTKSGSSTWTLNGINTYAGATTVSEGTLSLTQNNSLPDSSGVNVATAGTLDLNFTGTDTVSSFSIDGVLQASGEWGRIGSGAANQTARITGDGRILATPAGSAYDTWATSKGLTGANNGANQDAENDGLENVLEFVLNGDPLASDTSILPVLSDDGTYFIFTFNRADESLAEVNLTFEYGSDLTGWTPVAIPTSATGIPVNITDNGATDQVQVKILKTSAVGGKLFGRLQAVK